MKINDRLAKVIFFILLSIASGFIGGFFAFKNTGQLGISNQTIIADQNFISSIAENVGQSVVSISVRSNQVNNTIFGPQNVETRSAGTGFIISRDGYVLTNRHVIPDGSRNISITLSNGETLDNVSLVAKTKDSDPLDVAFLKINDAKGNVLKPIELGNSGEVKVGDRVIAIGNALGQLQNTVTSGIVSGFGRDVTAGSEFDQENLVNLIQTDAAINQGNSGGPLVNADGKVIGVNTAIAGGGAQNIGFAIPVNDLKGLIKSILDKGELKRPFLGVRYVTLTPEIAGQKKLAVENGAYLADTQSGPAVIRGSAADKAGLKKGDVITAVDGKDIDERNTLTSLLAQYYPGDTIKLTIQRGDSQLELNATLQEL